MNDRTYISIFLKNIYSVFVKLSRLQGQPGIKLMQDSRGDKEPHSRAQVNKTIITTSELLVQ